MPARVWVAPVATIVAQAMALVLAVVAGLVARVVLLPEALTYGSNPLPAATPIYI